METKFLNDSFVETKLKVENLVRKDNGTYFCKAQGPSGEASAAVPLYVLGKNCSYNPFFTHEALKLLTVFIDSCLVL